MIRQAIILTVILFVGLGAVATTKAQGQQMYSWTDENGVVHFSDTRPEGQQVSEQMIPNDPQPAADNPYQQVENQPSIAQQRRDEIAQKSQQAQVNQAVYSAQCSSWQAEVDRLEPNRRVFFTNEEGETERMDDVERTDRVAQLKNQIAKNCR
ncbi:MAG: DUF4124 domain-containing protein [Gammaproteobacteria bacterium]|jgi:hypothetical protein|nr:DUF4124 domain-containing protein [Gammaproteobacteria bacterium]